MKLQVSLFYTSLALCTLSFGVAFLVHGSLAFAVLNFSLGAFWAISHWREWSWGGLLSFGLFCLMIAFGVWRGVGVLWLLVGIAATIVAWDMARWIAQAKRAGRIIGGDKLIRHHLLRLGGVLVIGLGLSTLALNLKLAFTFGWALILGLLMILALSRVISFLREQ